MNETAGENGPPQLNRVRWLIDLVRLEIMLWEDLDARLKKDHSLSLPYFEVLYFIDQQNDKRLRVGELAKLLKVTVGGTSKLVDRMEADGVIRREADPTNRRASLIFQTAAGETAFAAASQTFETEMQNALGGVLSQAEQLQMQGFIERLLKANLSQNPEGETERQ